ncbi:MAG: HDIG domain-containing protein [Trueperaceae bacterium]|nr:HDIG domain-containing protein [Trueperaceae bacterium]
MNARYVKNAAWRSLTAFIPTLVAPDDSFARGSLRWPEYRLYLDMDVRDRYHACLVAKTLAESYPEASSELIGAALLHDVGKSAAGYSAVSRIAAHLWAPRHVPAEPRLDGLRGVWQLHRHHSRYGAAMIRAVGGSERIAEIVERHHNPGDDRDAALLHSVDEQF